MCLADFSHLAMCRNSVGLRKLNNPELEKPPKEQPSICGGHSQDTVSLQHCMKSKVPITAHPSDPCYFTCFGENATSFDSYISAVEEKFTPKMNIQSCCETQKDQ